MMAKDVKKALEARKAALQFELNERQARALAFLKRHKSLTLSDYLKLNPKTPSRTASRDLTILMKEEILQASGEKRGRHYSLSGKRGG